MSILHDYLSVLEKKKGREAVAEKASVAQGKKMIFSPYLGIGLVFFVGAIIFLFALKNIKGLVSVATEKVQSSQKGYKVEAGGFNSFKGNRASAELSLMGIIYNPDSPSAVIDGKFVVSGEKINGWQVLEISPSEVKLENLKNNSLLTLKLDSVLGQ